MTDTELKHAIHAVKDIATELKEKNDCVEYAIVINNMKTSLEWITRKEEDETPEASYKLVKVGV